MEWISVFVQFFFLSCAQHYSHGISVVPKTDLEDAGLELESDSVSQELGSEESIEITTPGKKSKSAQVPEKLRELKTKPIRLNSEKTIEIRIPVTIEQKDKTNRVRFYKGTAVKETTTVASTTDREKKKNTTPVPVVKGSFSSVKPDFLVPVPREKHWPRPWPLHLLTSKPALSQYIEGLSPPRQGVGEEWIGGQYPQCDTYPSWDQSRPWGQGGTWGVKKPSVGNWGSQGSGGNWGPQGSGNSWGPHGSGSSWSPQGSGGSWGPQGFGGNWGLQGPGSSLGPQGSGGSWGIQGSGGSWGPQGSGGSKCCGPPPNPQPGWGVLKPLHSSDTGRWVSCPPVEVEGQRQGRQNPDCPDRQDQGIQPTPTQVSKLDDKILFRTGAEANNDVESLDLRLAQPRSLLT